jgi:5-deoxy-5-amino-3-dehydroquinate synthase
MTSTVTVLLGERSYDVVVGSGAREGLSSMIPPTAKRVALVTQTAVPLAVDPQRPTTRFEIGQGEEDKSLATIETLCRGFAEIGLTRNDVVVAVGGGMVTDVAGFAAASWHRGVPVIHVATTLLGMIDAAVGGKTGVNLPEGKNLVGAIWQPHGVICDLDALATLPERELRSGHGEMAKYHFLTGDDLTVLDTEARIARCVEIKAAVVAADEREHGGRALLNYGHTLAHALEVERGHRVAHGEAVAIGLVFAARLAERLDRIDGDRVEEHRHVVETVYGLDSRLPPAADRDELLVLMGRDKKAIDGLTFVLDGPRGLESVPGIDPAIVRSVLASN